MTSMPLHAPLYPLEWKIPEFRQLSVICETEEENVKEILKFTPFEFVTNKFTVEVMDMSKHTLGGFYDSAVYVPARFKDIFGLYVAYMYVDLRSPNAHVTICAAREMFGYPKKGAIVEYIEEENKIRGITKRGDVKIMDISCELSDKEVVEIPQHLSSPSILLLKVIPSCEKNGKPLTQVIVQPSAPSKLKIKKFGKASVEFGRLDSDPIYLLSPTKVLGGIFTVGGFSFTYGKVLATL